MGDLQDGNETGLFQADGIYVIAQRFLKIQLLVFGFFFPKIFLWFLFCLFGVITFLSTCC